MSFALLRSSRRPPFSFFFPVLVCCLFAAVAHGWALRGTCLQSVMGTRPFYDIQETVTFAFGHPRSERRHASSSRHSVTGKRYSMHFLHPELQKRAAGKTLPLWDKYDSDGIIWYGWSCNGSAADLDIASSRSHGISLDDARCGSRGNVSFQVALPPGTFTVEATFVHNPTSDESRPNFGACQVMGIPACEHHRMGDSASTECRFKEDLVIGTGSCGKDLSLPSLRPGADADHAIPMQKHAEEPGNNIWPIVSGLLNGDDTMPCPTLAISSGKRRGCPSISTLKITCAANPIRRVTIVGIFIVSFILVCGVVPLQLIGCTRRCCRSSSQVTQERLDIPGVSTDAAESDPRLAVGRDTSFHFRSVGAL